MVSGERRVDVRVLLRPSIGLGLIRLSAPGRIPAIVFVDVDAVDARLIRELAHEYLSARECVDVGESVARELLEGFTSDNRVDSHVIVLTVERDRTASTANRCAEHLMSWLRRRGAIGKTVDRCFIVERMVEDVDSLIEAAAALGYTSVARLLRVVKKRLFEYEKLGC